jgi:hypothetical protein
MRSDPSTVWIVGVMFLAFGLVVKAFPAIARAARMPSSTLYFVTGIGIIVGWAILRSH